MSRKVPDNLQQGWREAISEELKKALREELGGEAYAYGYFTEGGVEWNGKAIEADAVTDELPALGFTHKTFYFLSDADGTLTVEVKEPDGEWREYDSVSITANKLEQYTPPAQAVAFRLRFSASATVTAWYVMRR